VISAAVTVWRRRALWSFVKEHQGHLLAVEGLTLLLFIFSSACAWAT